MVSVEVVYNNASNLVIFFFIIMVILAIEYIDDYHKNTDYSCLFRSFSRS